ncbi:hypothetical protein CXK86_18915 [Paenibacillus sp. BGI2013]|nr:hypothetical protein CXK86_18915 [Paenibacillus sp. BGI2013]
MKINVNSDKYGVYATEFEASETVASIGLFLCPKIIEAKRGGRSFGLPSLMGKRINKICFTIKIYCKTINIMINSYHLKQVRCFL